MASIHKQPNGRWKVRYRTPDGQGRAQRFDRKTDAKRFLHGVEADKARRAFVDPRSGRELFGKYAEDVLEARLSLRPASRARDESYLHNHVLPAFAQTQIARIRKADVQRWVRELSEGKGLAPRTVRECYRIFGGIMREAVEDRLIPESPCRRVALPRVEHSERRWLTAEQVETLADAMDERYSATVHVGAYLGLRWGELAGLKRQHLHLLKRQLRVVGSLERFNGGFRYVPSTKSASGRRTLPLPTFLVDALAHHLTIAPDSEFVFPSTTGAHLDYNNYLKRYWRPAVKRADLEPLTIHELRHTAAAIMIDLGANPITVQRRLGHKDVTTTLQQYGHIFPEQDDVLTSRLDGLRARSLEARVSKLCPSEVAKIPTQSAT